jgi:hypothetical protein
MQNMSRKRDLFLARGDRVRGSGSGAVGGSGESHLPRTPEAPSLHSCVQAPYRPGGGRSARVGWRRRRRISQVPGEPHVCNRSRSLTPVGTATLRPYGVPVLRPPWHTDAPRMCFEARSRGNCTPCVRVAAPVARMSRNTRFRRFRVWPPFPCRGRTAAARRVFRRR